MLAAKMYAVAWLFVIAAAGTQVMTGSFDWIRMTIFGLLVSVLFFMGIVGVLTALMNKHYPAKIKLNKFENKPNFSNREKQK